MIRPSRWIFSAVLSLGAACGDGSEDPGVQPPPSAGCVAAGTGTRLHDNVADLVLANCLGEEVRLHARCGVEPGALWVVATTGWCTPCKAFVERFVLAHGVDVLTRAAVAEKTPGLDLLFVLGEDNQARAPTPAYCEAFAESLHLDPAMVLIDWSDTPVRIPLSDGTGEVTTNAMGQTWGAIDPYLGGGLSAYYPWWVLLRTKNMEYAWSRGASDEPIADALERLLGHAVDASLFE